jgi:hypothetical protein
MIKYSSKLKDEVEKISKYYEKNDTFEFLKKIIGFINECVNNFIRETYFIIPKKYIYNFTKDALKIWEKDGSEEELDKIKTIYLTRMSEQKPIEKIIKNRKQNAAMNCMLWILHNGRNDPQNQFVYDFIELFVEELEKLEIQEEYIDKTLEKYFSEII